RHACVSSTGEIFLCRTSCAASVRLRAVGAVAAGRAVELSGRTLPAAPVTALLMKTLRDIGSTPTAAPVRVRPTKLHYFARRDRTWLVAKSEIRALNVRVCCCQSAASHVHDEPGDTVRLAGDINHSVRSARCCSRSCERNAGTGL